VQQQDEEIALLKDDINILKGEKKRPVFVGSKLDKKRNPINHQNHPLKSALDPAKRKTPVASDSSRSSD
jgi:hypothetical protein